MSIEASQPPAGEEFEASRSDASRSGPVPVAGVVPAAGTSRRMGRDKRRIVWRGRTLLEHAVAALRDGGADPVIVVLEPGSPCVELEGLRGAQLAVNPAPQRGMLSSIRVGLQQLPADVAAAAVQPGDHPFVPPHAVAALLARFRAERPALLLPRYGGRRGHPLLLAREMFGPACACDDREGLRQLLRTERARLTFVDFELDPATDDDVDRPEDLARLDRDRE